MNWASFPQTHLSLRAVSAVAMMGAAVFFGWAHPASAFSQYTEGGDATNCGECHGDFRATSYISNTDGMNWGNLHNLHRYFMVDGDCEVCHSGGGHFPVRLHESAGGTGLDPISCAGCHGAAEDNVPENPEVAAGGSGYGAGLRQHHFNTGETACAACHLDADPANYMSVGEDVLPPYYANPGTDHPSIPTDSCNPEGGEDFAGDPEGLDNDGDDLYDGDDPDCGDTSAVEGNDLVVSAPNIITNYPNPFVNETVIEFEIPNAALAEVRILDVHGRVVRHFDVNSATSARQRIDWDGRDDVGRKLASGMYLCELRSGELYARQAVILLK